MMRMIISLLGVLTTLHLFLVSADELSVNPHDLPINETFGMPNQKGECGKQGDWAECPNGMCCSIWGWCGTTSDYCSSARCRSQCPPSYPQGSCGWQADGRKCPTGLCCSHSGWCGATLDYCGPKNCHSQCQIPSPPPPPPPSFPSGSCGTQFGNRKCPNDLCCSKYGWCGTTYHYCDPDRCQSQCKIPPPPPPAPPPPPPSYPQGRCGIQAAGRTCPTGLCCSRSGWCGTTSAYCAPGKCQSQCKTTLTSSFQNRMKSFYFNVV